jgi:hypothetical protein
MRKVSLAFASFAAGLTLVGCAAIPTGPNVMVLPGHGKSFDQFQYDDAICRDWSSQQIGTTRGQAATGSTATGAVVGTALGAATGAAVGAAAGDPGTGAAVGAGVGLLGGTATGAAYGQQAEYELQQRYDMAYVQCMYAKGHQVPVAGGYSRSPRSPSSYGSSSYSRRDLPPPPPGSPPPPPTVY